MLLGITLNETLSWQDHVNKIYSKASTRIHFLSQLKRTKMPQKDIVKVYVSIVRPVLEYCCQLWHAGLNDQQCHQLESIQERALRIAYPNLSYNVALTVANLSTLQCRRQLLCQRLFNELEEPGHRLHDLLPPRREITHNQRNPKKYPLPKVRTNRYKDSFVPYCLFNF